MKWLGQAKNKGEVEPELISSYEDSSSCTEMSDDELTFEEGASAADSRSVLRKVLCRECKQEIPALAVKCYHCRAEQKRRKVKDAESRTTKHTGFKVVEHDLFDEDDLDAGPLFTETEFIVSNKHIVGLLSRVGVQIHTRQVGKKDTDYIQYVEAFMLVQPLKQLEAMAAGQNNVARNFVAQVAKVKKRMKTQAKALLARNQTAFGALWFVFDEGTQVYSWKQGHKVATTIDQCYYNWYDYTMSGKVIKSNGQKFFEAGHQLKVHRFRSVMPLADLDVMCMDGETYAELTQRGEMFRKVAIGHNFRQYNGFMLKSFSSLFVYRIPAEGRVMIDPALYSRMNPNDQEFQFAGSAVQRHEYEQRQYGYGGMGSNSKRTAVFGDMEELADDDLFKTWPLLPGFSFQCKKWGLFTIADLSDIHFDDKAFDQLVLSRDKKDLIKCLVEQQGKLTAEDVKGNSSAGFTDIISGKGGGVIFLLHGPPGTGKTLTAEAVSEHLHTPLYCVSVGELGTTPGELEQKLQNILEIAGVWRASILMDEADVFLERRSKNDILRNAMVGIFLRLLEYHSGVLFLTTNRIKAIDDAFSSRINIALHYDNLDEAARGVVWRNFISAFKESGGKVGKMDYEELASYNLNGRQIRSTVKLSQSLASANGEKMSMRHIRTTVQVALSFESKFTEEVRKKRAIKKHYKNRMDKKGKGSAGTITETDTSLL